MHTCNLSALLQWQPLPDRPYGFTQKTAVIALWQQHIILLNLKKKGCGFLVKQPCVSVSCRNSKGTGLVWTLGRQSSWRLYPRWGYCSPVNNGSASVGLTLVADYVGLIKFKSLGSLSSSCLSLLSILHLVHKLEEKFMISLVLHIGSLRTNWSLKMSLNFNLLWKHLIHWRLLRCFWAIWQLWHPVKVT